MTEPERAVRIIKKQVGSDGGAVDRALCAMTNEVRILYRNGEQICRCNSGSALCAAFPSKR